MAHRSVLAVVAPEAFLSPSPTLFAAARDDDTRCPIAERGTITANSLMKYLLAAMSGATAMLLFYLADHGVLATAASMPATNPRS